MFYFFSKANKRSSDEWRDVIMAHAQLPKWYITLLFEVTCTLIVMMFAFGLFIGYLIWGQ